MTALVNGNFVLSQPSWENLAGDTVGVVTLIDGAVGAPGVFDSANSLTGSTHGDLVGRGLVTPLPNSNYIVASPDWRNGAVINAGAVTWQSGTVATGAVVSGANSLVGTVAESKVGNGGVTVLANGNAVVHSPDWKALDNTPSVATTFINGTSGLSGAVSAENSLIYDPAQHIEAFIFGSFATVAKLPNGNYVVTNVALTEQGTVTNAHAALTLGDGQTGVSGVVSVNDSLLVSDPLAVLPVVALTNSNYVVQIAGGTYFFSSTAVLAGDLSTEGLVPLTRTYALTNGNYVLYGGPLDQPRVSLLVDGTVGIAGDLPEENVIMGTDGVALLNGNYALASSVDLIVGDGTNLGVSATTTDGLLAGAVSPDVIPVSDDGSFVVINNAFDISDVQDVGAIVFVGSSPDFNTGTLNSNFAVGTSPNTSFSDVTLDDVNEQFYVKSASQGISRILVGSTVDGFPTAVAGSDVNLSLSSNVATEADETGITVTATAASAVSGNQTVEVAVSGTGITQGDYTLPVSTITILDGETTGSVTLTVQRDIVVEGTESLTVQLGLPSSGIQLGTTTQQTIAITDSVVPQLVLDNVSQFPSDTTPTFTWNDIGANRYEVWLQQNSLIQGRIQTADRFVTGTAYTSTEVLTGGTYRFWVRANDSGGNVGSWVPSRVFEYPMAKPNLLAPLSAVSTPRPTFTWEAVPGAQTYQIWIGTSTGRIIEGDIVGTSWTPSQDLPEGSIRWWIRDMASTSGGWSDVGNASIGAGSVSGPTQVLSPTGSGTDTTPTFTWQAIAGSSRYILHVQDLTSGNVVIRENQLTTTSYTPTTALASGSYRVWVKAIGSSGQFTDGIWSSAVDFSIAAVSSESSDSLAPLLTNLPQLLNRIEHTTEAKVMTDRAAAPGDVVFAVDTTTAEAKRSVAFESVESQPVPTIDAPDTLLSLLWEQQQLSEWLLTGEHS